MRDHGPDVPPLLLEKPEDLAGPVAVRRLDADSPETGPGQPAGVLPLLERPAEAPHPATHAGTDPRGDVAPGDDIARRQPSAGGQDPVDVREEEGTLIVDAEVPGFKRDEIEVSIENGMLHIVAERKPEEHKGTRHLTERRYTRVERAFTLPAEVDESKVQAKLDNGVLHLEMPEVEEKKARRIEVK